jgi:AbrB family looped-hinge helix DNA binding protein
MPDACAGRHGRKRTTAEFNICRAWDYNEGMETYTARLEKSGRILIPAPIRRQLGLSEGSQVMVKVESSGALEITSRAQALAKVRGGIRQYIPAGRDLVAELIQDRRAEAAREDTEATRS